MVNVVWMVMRMTSKRSYLVHSIRRLWRHLWPKHSKLQSRSFWQQQRGEVWKTAAISWSSREVRLPIEWTGYVRSGVVYISIGRKGTVNRNCTVGQTWNSWAFEHFGEGGYSAKRHQSSSSVTVSSPGFKRLGMFLDWLSLFNPALRLGDVLGFDHGQVRLL